MSDSPYGSRRRSAPTGIMSFLRRYPMGFGLCALVTNVVLVSIWTAFFLEFDSTAVKSAFRGTDEPNPEEEDFTPPTNVLTGSADEMLVDKSVYDYWDSARNVHVRNIKTECRHHIFTELGVVTPLREANKAENTRKEWSAGDHQVPVEAYLWARNITRAAKQRLTDNVVVISHVVSNLGRISSELRRVQKTNTVFIALGSVAMEHNLRDGGSNVFVLSLRRLRSSPLGFSEDTLRSALIEVADVFISVDGTNCFNGYMVETPTVVSLSHRGYCSERYEVVKVNGHGLPANVISQVVAGQLNSPRPEYVFHSYLDPSMGYGSSAEQMLLGLDKRNTTVGFLPITLRSTAMDAEQQVDPRVLELKHTSGRAGLFYIGYFVPHDIKEYVHRAARKAKLAVIYTTFETTRAPTKWAAQVNMYDGLLVSCSTIKSAFASVGVTVPIGIAPLGVNTKLWFPMKRSEESTFTFLMLADGYWKNHRKNYQLAFDAFSSAFEGNDDVQLIMKVTYQDDEITKIEKALPSNVNIYKGRFPQRKLMVLMRQSHVFLFPSHGEGYGLPPREAMATGIPAILAGFGGLEEIATDEISVPLNWTYENATGYVDFKDQNDSDNFGSWAAIEKEELVEKMKFAHTNRQEMARRGANAARYVQENETFDATSRAMLAFVRGLYLGSADKPKDTPPNELADAAAAAT